MPLPTNISNHSRLTSAVVAVVLLLAGLSATVIGLAQQKTPPTVPKYMTPTAIAPATSNQKTSTQPSGPVLPPSKPLRLKIPAIKTDDSLIELGKNSDGSVQVPSGDRVDDPGWYKYSPTPGSYGASVILGHVDDIKGPSAFWELEKLQTGQTIEVTRADGVTAVFTISSVEMYPKDDFPTEKVYTSDNTAALRLVTCGGFNKSSGTYDTNTVVFAKLTGSRH